MKVVLDTNILVSALMRDGFTRSLLLHPDLDLATPEYALDEVHRHLPTLAKRMSVPTDQAGLLVQIITDHVETLSQGTYAHELMRAKHLLEHIDPDDAPFAALAFALDLPLWTQDKALQECAGLATITTKDVAIRLGLLG